MFNSAQTQELWIAKSVFGDSMQATIVLTAPADIDGLTLGQFAFSLTGPPGMLAGLGIPTTVPDFTSSAFDVEVCPSGPLSCSVPWGFAQFGSGSTLSVEVVSSLAPVPIPSPSILLPPFLLGMLALRRGRKRT